MYNFGNVCYKASHFFFFCFKIEILLYLNLSVYVCDYLKKKRVYIWVKLLPRDLNLAFCLPHLTCTFTYVMIIAQRVHSDKASQFLRYYKYVTKLKYIQRDNLTYVAILYTFLVPKFHSNLLYTFFFWEKNCYIDRKSVV